MWSCVDAVGVNLQPILDYRPMIQIFYVIIIVLLCMLFLNLFVGVVCETFNRESATLSFNHIIGSET